MKPVPTTRERPDAWQIATQRRRQWIRHVLIHPALTAAQKTVLCALETFTDYRDGANAFPGEAQLADACGLQARAVRAALSKAQHLGLIERTTPANSRKGRAAVYRLIAVIDEASEDRHGGAGPDLHDRHGAAGPDLHDRHGGAGPDLHDRHGGAGPDLHDRHGGAGPDVTTGMAVPPTKELLHTHQGVLRNWGTALSGRGILAPSRFCDEHPQGTRVPCGNCANARTAFDAWQADATIRDVEIANAAELDRRRKRAIIDSCPDCDDFGRHDDLSPCDHFRAKAVAHA